MAENPPSAPMASFARPKGVVIDYWATLNPGNLTNFVFRGDTTYFLVGDVSLYGTTTLEGGCVIKATNSSTLKLSIKGPLDCRTTLWRPAVFTGKDDDSIGEQLACSTNAPSGSYGDGNLYLDCSTANYALHNLNIRYGGRGIWVNDAASLTVDHAQFVHGGRAFTTSKSPFQATLRNILAYDMTNGLYGATSNVTIRGEHWTFHKMAWLNSGLGQVNLTNCLLISVTNTGSYSGCNVVANLDDTGIFQPRVGAAGHYLADGSQYRNAGTTNISTSLRNDFARMTTYPPMVLTNTVLTNSTTLTPVAGRDVDTPDLGYHYPGVDWALTWLTVTNQSTLTLTPGTVIATFSNSAICLADSSQLVCEGTADQRIQFLRYNAVQEDTNIWGPCSMTYTLNTLHATNALPSCRLRFCDFNALSGEIYHLYSTGEPIWRLASLSARDCAFYTATLYVEGLSTTVCGLTNNLFFRGEQSTFAGGMAFSFFNNLGYGAVLMFSATNGLTASDNAFYNVLMWGMTNGTTGTNAYIAMPESDSRFYPTNAKDLILTSFTFTNGPLGDFYQVSTNLVNAGSRSAAAAGLYYYTTQASQTPETNSWVDIGLHYVALDANGLPTDGDGDGIPDHLEDANGDGTVNSGETDRTSATDVGLRVQITKPKNNSPLL